MSNNEETNINVYDTYAFKRSRKVYIAQQTFEYFVSLLVTDAFLAKLLTELGLSDFLIGVISSFVTLSFVFQLLSVFVMRAKITTKRLVIISDTVSQLFFMLMYLIPFIHVGANTKKIFIVLAVLVAYACKYLIVSLYFKWANSYVEPEHRAIYSANKEIISLVGGIIFTTVVGAIIDKFENIGNLRGGFLFVAVSLLVLNICNFISLMLIKKDDKSSHTADNLPLRSVIKHTLYNKSFRNVIILTCLWEFAKYFSIGFMGVYKTKELAMSVFAVQIINMIANGCRIIISRRFGKFSDKYSFAKGMELALCIAALGFLFNMFATPTCWYFIIIYTILFNCSYAGLNQNSYNITYSYVRLEYISQAMALKNSVGGICGFFAALIGGKVLQFVQLNENVVFGKIIYGQQILSGVSFMLTVITLLFLHFVVAKQDVKVQ